MPQEVIRAKRDGKVLSDDEIASFIAALTNNVVTEGQAAAFAMAVYFQGMNIAERVALTKAMRDSGTVLAAPGADPHLGTNPAVEESDSIPCLKNEPGWSKAPSRLNFETGYASALYGFPLTIQFADDLKLNFPTLSGRLDFLQRASLYEYRKTVANKQYIRA